jgi:hypothetical protein
MAANELTEMFDIDPERVDLVKNPATGFPILLMKALDAPEAPAAPAASATDASKETPVPEVPAVTETPAAPEPQADKPAKTVEKSVAEIVQEELAKAVSPLQEVIKGLEDQMAVLKSTPIPGGPVVTAPQAQRNESAQAGLLAEAARHDRLAKSVTDRELVRYHEGKAAELRKAANG